MTLIITALADDAVIQVSDRQLTRGEEVLQKPANKALCISCSDANFTVAFTGVAEILGAPAADWLLDHLASLKASALPFPSILESLRNQATATWPRLSASARGIGITFVFAGFGRAGPFYALLSNREGRHGNRLPAVSADFQSGIWLRNKKRLRKLDIVINGCEDAVTGTIDRAIQSVRRRFLNKTADKRADTLVELVRRAADHATLGKYIGKDCMSVIVPAFGAFIARYHPTESHPAQYAPNLLTNGMAFKGVEFSLPPGWTIKLGGS
jgi:hypothetical protein